MKYLLEFEISTLVCHPLVTNTELARGRLLGVDIFLGKYLGVVKNGPGCDLGVVDDTSGGNCVAYVGRIRAHGGQESEYGLNCATCRNPFKSNLLSHNTRPL